MKEYIAMLLIGLQLLTGSMGAVVNNSTEVERTAPTLSIEVNKTYENPLNGEILEEPYTGRVFASTISNVI